VKKAIVIGSGAGGATAARELQGTYDVTILEAGREFRPFALNLKIPENLKKTGLLFDAREISLLFPTMKVRRASGSRNDGPSPGSGTSGMMVVCGIGTGGTTTIATGNAVRLDHDFRRMGIDLDDPFAELAKEIPITAEHRNLWRPPTVKLFDIAETMGLNPRPTPKMGHYRNCRNCGRCVLGCPFGIKWDSRVFLREAVARGAHLVTKAKAERLEFHRGRANGVIVRTGLRRRIVPADLVVVAAGGLSTPVIMKNSGLEGVPRLFVDPVLCVAAPYPDARQNTELPMPFIVERDGYILSPYFDHLSFFFNREWKSPARNILSLMIKLADSNSGTVEDRTIHKILTPDDKQKLSEAVDLCAEIFGRLGIRREALILGTLNAGHPGGMFPLSAAEAQTLHSDHWPENVFIADASLFPVSLGRPPILTIMALAKAVARRIITTL